MALMNSSQVNFDDLRLIVCLNGFTINDQFQIVEFGFWSRKLSGNIPFKSTKVWSKLNHLDRLSVNYLTSEYHGIGLEQLKYQDALHQTDIFGSIRSIYHLCDDGVENRKLIGYLGNECLLELLGKLGIGNYPVKINDMYPASSIQIDEIRNNKLYGEIPDFEICKIHTQYNGNDFRYPVCARAIACFLAKFCEEKSMI